MSARFIIGDSLTVLRSLPDASVDLVLSSPPFLALRSYLPADHPNKAQEMGSEPTPGAFIDTLLTITEECRRVLAPHGSLCFELGDTYAGSGGAGGDYINAGLRDGQPKFDGSASRGRAIDRADYGGAAQRWDFAKPGTNSRLASGDGWPLDKSLCLIPELFRVALVYGFNPLTGRTTPRWRARNVVRWCRPNPPVGALADKVRPATSDMVVACMSRRRYFDLDAVRTPAQVQMGRAVNGNNVKGADAASIRFEQRVDSNPAGAPPLDHWWHDEDTFDQDAWLISTEPYKGSHYATWPSELCVRPIEAMCPRRVCRTCGKPSERIVGPTVYSAPDRPLRDDDARRYGSIDGKRHNDHRSTTQETVGWTDCGCVVTPSPYDRGEGPGSSRPSAVCSSGSMGNTPGPSPSKWRNGVVLDPFAGSGTTLAVATGHGRDAIGIDLDERNAELVARRVGMWLTVEQLERSEES